MKKRIIVSLIFLVVLIILVISNNISWFDEPIYCFLNSFNSDKMTNIMKFFTFFAETKTIVILSILSLISFWFKNNKSLYIIGSIASSTVINIILKLIFRRDRPNHIHYVVENTYSFPSGHAMASMTFYGSIIVLLLNSKINKIIKYIVSIILGLLIFIIGVSRVYLGVHYPSDILGGWLISFILLNILNEILKGKDYESINNRSK